MIRSINKMKNNYIVKLNNSKNKEIVLETIKKEKDAIEQLEGNFEQVSDEYKEINKKYIELRKNAIEKFEKEIQSGLSDNESKK